MNNKYENYALYGLLALSVAALVFAVVDWAGNNPASLPAATGTSLNIPVTVITSGFPAISTGSTGQGDVEIELTPSWINGKLDVEIAVNTHSVDLSGFNLKEITILQYGEKTLNPVSVPALSGHHNSGKMVFEPGEEPKSFAIKILGIPAVNKRVFEW